MSLLIGFLKPVRVAPEAYYLFDTAATGVPELCDAFKVRHIHESQNLGGANAGGKTPYTGRTPGRTPAAGGMTTPGHISVRQIGRTPNPYGPPGATGNATPGYGAMPPPQTPYGYQTPGTFGQRPPPPPTAFGQPPPDPTGGMGSQRAPPIVQNGGWGQGSSGGW